jgi:GT2 family glycosyltransferase
MSRLSRFLRHPRRSMRRLWHSAPVVALTDKAAVTAEARAELKSFLKSRRRLAFAGGSSPRVSVLLVLWNQAHLTLRCLQALHREFHAGTSIEVVIVDNGSTDATQTLLSHLTGVRHIRNKRNLGFVAACNQGAAAARGHHLLLLNNDTAVRPGAIDAALACSETAADIGAVGGRLILPSNRLQEAGSIVWSDGGTQGYCRGSDPEAIAAMFRRDVDYCSGAFLLTPLELWNRLGGFDPIFSPAYYEEADYCLRLWAAGWRVVYEPSAAIDHFEFGSESAGGEAVRLMLRNRETFVSRHAAILNERHLPPDPHGSLQARVHWSRRRPRLLVLDNEVPCEGLGAGYPRMRRLLQEAVAAGWDVTFFPLHRPNVDWAEARREFPPELEIAAGIGWLGLGGFLASRSGFYHTLMVSRPDNMRLVRPVLTEHAEHIRGCRLIYDAEALFAARTIVMHSTNGSPLSPAEADALIDEEIGLTAGADAVICVTPAEAALFRDRQQAPVHCVSHLVTVRADVPGFDARRGYLFVGRLLEQDSPNWVGLTRFFREVWPLIRRHQPDATLRVVGHLHAKHEELKHPGVELLGHQGDLSPHYDAARVFIAPTFFAAGVAIKILEAAAAGLPVVTFPLLARQMGWTNGRELLAAEAAADFAAAARRLHDDADAWEAVRLAGQQAVAREYSGATFRHALGNVLESKKVTATTFG